MNDFRTIAKGALPCALLPVFFALVPACSRIPEKSPPPAAVTVDFLEHLDLEANGLAPQVVRADGAHNRVIAACANSSGLAVLDCASGEVRVIPLDSRMPRRLRNEGVAVSRKTGEVFLCGARRLVAADPAAGEARSYPLPGDFEAIALDEEHGRAYLAGRTCRELAIFDGAAKEVRLVPYAEPAPPLPFMAASAPPPIRFPFVDPDRGRVYVLDGCTATLFTFDAAGEELIASRKLPLDPLPRWHAVGFDPGSGRIFAALENERREAVCAAAVDTRGEKDEVVKIPKGFTEPAGVACDPERGEIYIPYDNNKTIHVVRFGEKPEVEAVEVPSMGMDATRIDPASGTLYVTSWMQAALYAVDLKARKRTLTVPFFPVYPHMNSMAFNEADGKLYVPTGSTAVNGTFGAALSVFDPAGLAFSEIETGFGPVSMVRKPGADSFYVFGAEREYAEVRPDGTYDLHRLPFPYPHQALVTPDKKSVVVAYGPHSSMWPHFYIGGARDGIFTITADGRDGVPRVTEDRLTPRLVQGMVFDGSGRLWALQNTWGREEPFLLTYPGEGEKWRVLRLPPAVDNECLQRLIAKDDSRGLLFAGRTGNLNTDKGLLHVIDTEKNAVAATVELGRTPTGICVLPERGLVCVASFDDDTVTVIGTAGLGAGPAAPEAASLPMAVIPAGRKPIAVAAHEESGTIYVVDHLGESLTVLEAAAKGGPEGVRKEKEIAFPPGALPDNILVEPLSGHVFVTAHGSDEARIYRYDPKSGSVTTIHRQSFPYGETTFDGSNAAFRERGQWGDAIFRITAMALDEKGRLWVTDYLGGKVWILKVF